MSQNVTEEEAILLTMPQKSAEGKVGHAVGEDIEALQMPKGGANKIGPAGNDDPKARTVPRKGNKGKGK